MDLDEAVAVNRIMEDLNEAEGDIVAGNRLRRLINKINAFDLSDREFIKNFRLSKNLAREVMNLVSPFIDPPSRASALSVETKVLVSLHFYGHGSYQECIGKHVAAGISQSSVSNALRDVTNALNQYDLINRYIIFPRNIADLRHLRNRFYAKFGFPGVVGCVDGTFVAIKRPDESEHIYVNRKNYHSLNVQLVCDENLKILNICSRFPGSSNDRHVWRQSQISNIMEQIYRNFDEPFFLLGDSGYNLRPWLLTPLEEDPNDPDSPEGRFNKALMSARSTVERCNGVLKNRFRCLLRHRVLHYSPTMASKITNACAVLHNMCILNDIPEPNEDNLGDIDFGIYINDEPHVVVHNQVNPDLHAARLLQQRIVNNHFANR